MSRRIRRMRLRGLALLASAMESSMAEGDSWLDDVVDARMTGNRRSICCPCQRSRQIVASKPFGPRHLSGLRLSRRGSVASSASTYLQTMGEITPMNRYGHRAMVHWKTYAKSRYEALEDPQTFFTELGVTAASQIAEMTASMDRDVPQDLPYLERVGRLMANQREAEEIVLTELIYSVPTEPTSLQEEAIMLLGSLPSRERVQELIDEIELREQEQQELDGLTPGTYSEEALEDLERLRGLERLLVSIDQTDSMSEAELRDLMLALGRYRPTPIE